jgi:hypothetical protein
MAKKSKRIVRGGKVRCLGPDWRPLLDFRPDQIPEFMWMFRVDLDDGTVVEAYKHSRTRQYLHLDHDGRAYVSLGNRRYEETDLQALLDEALAGHRSRASIVRRNEWIDGERIGWARSATRHRIPRRQTLFVIQHAGICFQGGVGRRGEPRLYVFSDDEERRPLEVVAYENGGGELLVVHSMLLREKFEEDYEEAMRWRK